MHRLTAKLLLVFALIGSLAPIAMAASAAPHACCLRKGLHHCQDSLAPETGELIIRNAVCSQGDCSRAVITAQWAHPQPRLASFLLPSNHARVAALQPDAPVNAYVEFQSTRAPPAL
jgi:hypothetical protein